ncbi:MAG: dethiobiotin synthase [Daejeonella sp.]|uniref:dethiobiotin synthase n=1 Tax=Daejeonella sp. TaxID=2805397 RepID=UPI0027324185|nr:dethiobiotin synthase [Daejeonella sp.]MDP3466761.1 dethiobiotin synthase [Daejeonella sp.]
MRKRPIFITGIGTGIGKTIVSAILVQKLKADYWKPIQSGDLDNSDTDHVRSLVTNNTTTFHPESYRLTQPFSPHKSAAIDGIYIDPQKIVLPDTNNQLIIEGAGGLMVPLNDNFLMIDLIKKLDAEVILVSKNYLGSINHTLMSDGILKSNGIKLSRLIFSGDHDHDSEGIIRKYLQIESIHIPYFNVLNADSISAFTEKMIW